MSSIAIWLASISWPIITRILVAAGVGTITYLGINTAISALFDSSKNMMGSIAPDVLFILARAGIFEAMAITSGGLISGIALMNFNKFALRSVGS